MCLTRSRSAPLGAAHVAAEEEALTDSAATSLWNGTAQQLVEFSHQALSMYIFKDYLLENLWNRQNCG